MELRQLQYLVEVVDAGGFTRAAERLHVAQPGVSAQIRRLEAELGQPLLDRSPRAVRPTAAGAAVLPYARAALAAVAGARLAVDELAGLVRGHVAVGTIGSHGIDLPELLATFHDGHPGVEITVGVEYADALIDGIRDGRLDVALIGLPDSAVPDALAVQVVASDPLVAAVAAEDALARRSSIPLAGLRERPLISLPHGSGLRAVLEAGCAAAGFRPHVAFEAGDPGVAAELAARGLGVAVVPASLAAVRGQAVRGQAVRALPITRPALHGRVALAWRRTGPGSPAARAFVAHARAVLPDVQA